MSLDGTTKPPPPEGAVPRWTEAELRLRYWEGNWEDQLSSDVADALGDKRREVMGILDQSCNLPEQLCRERSVLYLEPPEVLLDGEEAPITEDDGPIEASGLWSLMSDFQGRTLLLNDYFMRIDINERGELLNRAVRPDRMIAASDPTNPERPVRVEELAQHTVGDQLLWTWDVIDISEPGEPSRRIEIADADRTDVTVMVLGLDPDVTPNLSGENYPYRFESGRGEPFIPGTMYHRYPLQDVWSWMRGPELMRGGRMASVLWSFWVHLMKNACWEQRVMINGKLYGGSPKGDHGTNYVTPDPTRVMQIVLATEAPPGAQVSIDSWKPAADPVEIAGAIDIYSRRVATREGVGASDAIRTSGSAESGYAISLNNQGKREARRQYRQPFGRYDAEALGKSAAILNRTLEADGQPAQWGESGYTVIHREIPRSPEEEKALREQIQWELDEGFLTKPEALVRLRPGLSLTQATKIIDRNAAAGGQE